MIRYKVTPETSMVEGYWKWSWDDSTTSVFASINWVIIDLDDDSPGEGRRATENQLRTLVRKIFTVKNVRIGI